MSVSKLQNYDVIWKFCVNVKLWGLTYHSPAGICYYQEVVNFFFVRATNINHKVKKVF